MKNIELLSKICSVAGAPGHEKKIRDFIIGEMKRVLWWQRIWMK